VIDATPQAPPAVAQQYYYPPPDSPAVVPPDYPAEEATAWDLITADPDLGRSAALLADLGLDTELSLPFNGTLLLPNNAVRLEP
jgi:hypothetical protein